MRRLVPELYRSVLEVSAWGLAAASGGGGRLLTRARAGGRAGAHGEGNAPAGAHPARRHRSENTGPPGAPPTHQVRRTARWRPTAAGDLSTRVRRANPVDSHARAIDRRVWP